MPNRMDFLICAGTPTTVIPAVSYTHLLNQIARTLNEWHSPYPQLAGEVRAAVSDLAALKFEVLQKAVSYTHLGELLRPSRPGRV